MTTNDAESSQYEDTLTAHCQNWVNFMCIRVEFLVRRMTPTIWGCLVNSKCYVRPFPMTMLIFAEWCCAFFARVPFWSKFLPMFLLLYKSCVPKIPITAALGQLNEDFLSWTQSQTTCDQAWFRMDNGLAQLPIWNSTTSAWALTDHSSLRQFCVNESTHSLF